MNISRNKFLVGARRVFAAPNAVRAGSITFHANGKMPAHTTGLARTHPADCSERD